MNKLYVGNFPYETTENDLTTLFSPHGQVESVKIIFDNFQNRSKGFGFVEMADDQGAEAAIAALNGFEYSGRELRVNHAQERQERAPRGNSRGGGGGGGYQKRGFGGGGGGDRRGGDRGRGGGGGGGRRDSGQRRDRNDRGGGDQNKNRW